MIIYLATREVFLQHVREQRIEEEVRERYIAITGHKVAATEFRAWQNSLQCVGNVLQFKEIPPELGVAIEYRIHNTAKRIDLLLSGRNANGAPAAVIVELKQWETVEPTELDGVVRTFLGKGPRETTHPSYQAMSYGALLRGLQHGGGGARDRAPALRLPAQLPRRQRPHRCPLPALSGAGAGVPAPRQRRHGGLPAPLPGGGRPGPHDRADPRWQGRSPASSWPMRWSACSRATPRSC